MVPLLDLPLHIINKYRDTTTDGKLLPHVRKLGVEQRAKTARCGLRHRSEVDHSSGKTQFRNVHHAFFGHAARNRQPYDGVQTTGNDANLRPCDEQESGRGHEAVKTTVRKSENRTL